MEEYEQPPRRPVRLEEYMVNLHLDTKEPEEEAVRETCRVITSHPQRETCYAVEISTDSDEELCFPEEGLSTTGENTEKSPPKLGSCC